ncbi:hypothetical protein G6F68_010418 [Rhizopus microsporus]|nr:hypothetical protein G6F68_010418 [Rhizopus microsporus]
MDAGRISHHQEQPGHARPQRPRAAHPGGRAIVARPGGHAGRGTVSRMASGPERLSRNGNVPTDVPERVANAWVSWKFAPQWTASAGVRYVGKRYADAANRLEMAGYTTTNLALQWEPRRDLSLALRAFNVFDRQYAETAYYNQTQWLVGEGRRVELSANYRF